MARQGYWLYETTQNTERGKESANYFKIEKFKLFFPFLIYLGLLNNNYIENN